MTVKINADTSDGLKFVSDTSGAIDLQSGGTTKASMDSSGNITANSCIAQSSGGIETQIISSDSNSFCSIGSKSNHDVIIALATNETARFRTNGRVDFGTGSYTNGAKLTLTHLGNQVVGLRMSDETTTGTHNALQFLRNGTQVGKIETANQASTSYVTSSDYRMKENVNYTWDGTTKLKQLKPAEFTWKAEYDSNKTKVQGFLAHEVSDIVPEAVTGEKDAEEMQGIDQSKLVPLLVKTIQELEARITALESK